MLSKHLKITLLRNLSTPNRVVMVDNYDVNFFVNQFFFRHLGLLDRIIAWYLTLLYGVLLLLICIKINYG